ARGIAKGEARGEARCIAKGEARGEARGIAKGEARGIAKGEAAATSSLIIRYMKKHNVSGSEAMDALDIPESERDMYYSMISE
ncbi:MAG: hypothetical protein LUD81_05155, partial [Clostridiales bacterium]|nr:hypothetical protein [Clostridiales bacterium]